MAYVDVPKDLTNIKTKFIGNFTKRQCVCFGLGILVGFPGYFIARGAIGTTAAFYVLIALMAPFFLFGIVEKDGLPLEIYMLNFIRHTLAYPQIRVERSENIYEYYDEKRKQEIQMKAQQRVGKRGGKRPHIMNEWYAKDTSNKIKAVFDARMKDGKRCSGSIPYGYNRLATDKQTLVVDPVASAVVKRIFLLANEGKSPRAIAELLTEEKVLIPAAHAKEYHPEQYNGTKFSDPYLWGMSTIRAILSRQEYLGHTVLRKSVSTNFKLHKRKNTDEDEQYVFYNTHEPIISQELWDSVQKRKKRANRTAAKGTHFISLIRKCKEPTEISDLMFAELIDKIVVYEAEGVGKARTQKVDIYFNYVGQVDIAYTEEELAEIKAQEEQIEMERLAKQREREKAYREKRKAKKLAENGGEIVKTKICPHCQKEFVPTSNRQIFCSKDCCYQARQDKTKADREAEKGNHYYRQRVCAVCGSTYWPAHSQQKFCSEECQKQNHNEKSLEFYHKKRKEKSECKDLLQTKEPVSSTNSSEIITIPA